MEQHLDDHEQRLITESQKSSKRVEPQNIEDDEDENLDDQLPPSTRVMKIIKWNHEIKKFEIDPFIKQELETTITDPKQWHQFEQIYTEFPAGIHPKVKSANLCVAILMWSSAIIILFWVLYVLFIIF